MVVNRTAWKTRYQGVLYVMWGNSHKGLTTLLVAGFVFNKKLLANKNKMKKYLLFAFVLGLFPLWSFAADIITIDPVATNGCGAQSVNISGTLISPDTEEVGVWFSDEVVHIIGSPQATSSEPIIWNYGSKFLTEGSHEVFAEVITLKGVTTQTSQMIVISPCQPVVPPVIPPVVSHPIRENFTPKIVKALRYHFTKLLKLGSTGDEVKALQERLKSEGLYFGVINGNFDNLTKKALLIYQKKNKMPQTGTLYLKVRNKLNS
jgi:hypothetical protein